MVFRRGRTGRQIASRRRRLLIDPEDGGEVPANAVTTIAGDPITTISGDNITTV